MPTHQSSRQKKTVKRVMHEYKHGELKTARGARKVKNRKQAIAIALSEAGASKYDSPTERKRNLSRTKSKERRGETGQAAAEGRRRTTRKATTRKSSAKTTTARKTASSRASTRRSTPPRKSASTRSTARRAATQRNTSARKTTARRSTTQRPAVGGKTRAELYRQAQRRNIPRRSKMNKEQLARALRR